MSLTHPPTALYQRAVRSGDMLIVSGQLPVRDQTVIHAGRVGAEVTVEQAQEAAALAAQRCLDVLRAELGSLDAVRRVVRIGGYVAAADGFFDAPAVVNAASRTVLDALGSRGEHARVALGVASLPLNSCVEIEMSVEC
ncbi:RidA family protein [Streptomyces sp. NPDC004237]|uniref:RidA family protein n=1 Tax=Streptomyces sp. NPDC004237 TaxID=3154455 RepID=UPI0033B73CD2